MVIILNDSFARAATAAGATPADRSATSDITA